MSGRKLRSATTTTNKGTGGARALIEDGDRIRIDIPNRFISLLVGAEFVTSRRWTFNIEPTQVNHKPYS